MIPILPTPHLPARTGSWRVRRPVLLEERCRGCLLCWLFCPEGSIRREGKGVRLLLDYCKGCGICARECLHGALVMEEEARLRREALWAGREKDARLP